MAYPLAETSPVAMVNGPMAPTMVAPEAMQAGIAPTSQPYYPAQAPYQGYGSPAFAAQEQLILEQKQRLERVEQALLRLDKRMQLVERNELGRMTGAGAMMGPSAQVNAPAQMAFAYPALERTATPAPMAAYPAATDDAQAASLAQSLAQTVDVALYQDNIQPVSNRMPDTTIRGTLQAAPNTLGNGLPSLADPRANSQAMPSSAGQLAIWTVRYEPEKVWPDRDQLPASREVVDALRGSNTVTLVARGPNPTSKAFQERVRALSRYLAKVASLDTVPISTRATPGLDANTIELLATP
jgi:small-conductance mechanosensitive channel